jgi:hypothetical protein
VAAPHRRLVMQKRGEENEAADPADVRLLGTPTQMAEAYRLAHPLQQLWPVGHETA